MFTTLAPAEKKNKSKSANSNNKTTQLKVLPSIVKPIQLKGSEEESLQGKFKSANNQPAQLMAEEEEAIQGKFESANQPAQLMEEEEPLQGKFESANQPAQLMEEEEPLQGKFESANQPAQLMEEEEPLQGKFDTVQLNKYLNLKNRINPKDKEKEEEPLQGKFESANQPAQLMEEEEPLQGKFESTNQPAQLMEEEEPLQGKFESTNQPAQLMEEEEPLQGKFESTNQPAQLMEEEEPLQGKFESTNQPAQLMAEEEPLQGKFESSERKSSPNWSFQLKSNIGNSTNSETTQKSTPTANKTGLPDTLKSGVEQLSGVSMDDVKVNYNSSAPAQLHAHAYAQGKSIHVAPGQEKHLPHEAWHVAQQKQGRVQPTKQLKGKVPVNDDKGLENEADVMGAKAVAQGKLIKISKPIQKKQVNGVNKFSPVSQRVVIQRKPTDIYAMIENANKLLSDNIFTSDLGTESTILGKALEATDGLAAGAGGANKIVSGAANVVGALGDAASSAVGGAAEAAQGIVEAVGIGIRIVTSSISAACSMDKTFKGDEKKFTGGGKAAVQLGELLRQGAKAANLVLTHVNGSVSGSIMSMLPGLGLAIAGCDLLVNAYTAYNASTAQEQMGDVANLYRNDLTLVLGAPPETFGELFQNEKRGKFFNRETYLRIRPNSSAMLEEAKNGDFSAQQAFLRFNSLPLDTDFEKLYKAIRYYELGSKMQEINQKRKIQGMRNIFTDLIQIGAEIAKIFPADGGITAGVLTGVAGGAKAAQAAGKFLQTQGRNLGIPGSDSNRSENAKHLEYVTHTKSIYQYIADIDPSWEVDDESQLIKAEQFISATGADLGTVFSLTGKPQAEFLVRAMKKGR